MKNIKQFLKSFILFIPFTILMYLALIIISGYLPYQFLKPNINYRIGSYGHMYSRIKEIHNYKNIDILFLGSSHAYRGFDTRIFKEHNLKCFNLGSSSQTLIQTEVLLQRYLNYLNPKMIILEVSPIIFSSDGIESSLDLIANDKKDILTLTKLVNWSNIKTINTAIIGFYRNFMNLDGIFTEKRIKGDDIYISGGFVEKKLKFYSPEKIKKRDLTFNKNQVKAFKKCVDYIHSKNIKLILVQAPITKSLYNSYSNIQVFDDMILEYGNYYNFNNMLDLEDSLHFYDLHHLNQNGITVFNTYLIGLIELK